MRLLSAVSMMPLGFVLIAGCSSSAVGAGSDGASSGGSGSGAALDESTPLPDMTDEDRRALCDYVADLHGGYAKDATCEMPDGHVHSVKGPASAEECVDSFRSAASSCSRAATVGGLESCEKGLVNGVCDASVPSVCEPVFDACPDLDLG
jgi:hypothetical protein